MVVLEIYRECRVRGPRGEATVNALIDTGATISLMPRDIIEKCGMEDIKPADICSINACWATRSGYMYLKIPEGPQMRTIVFEHDMPIVGMPYLSGAGCDIILPEGTIICGKHGGRHYHK